MKNDINENSEISDLKNKFSKPSLSKDKKTRIGWSESSQAIHQANEDILILGEFPNLDDKNLKW